MSRALRTFLVAAMLVGCSNAPPAFYPTPKEATIVRSGFAVIVRGDDDELFVATAQHAANVLRAQGFKILEASSLYDINEIFEHLKGAVGPEDAVWFHYSGHGSREVIQPIYDGPHYVGTIRHPGGMAIDRRNLSYSDLFGLLSKVNPRCGVAVIGGCYSGAGLKYIPPKWTFITVGGRGFARGCGFENTLYERIRAGGSAERAFTEALPSARDVNENLLSTPEIAGDGCGRIVITVPATQ